MPNCALALPAPCVPPFLHRNCGVALGVWMFKVLPFFGVFHSLTIPVATSRKMQGWPGRKIALDSICQNLSMHVTRTALLIGGLAEKMAIPNDTIRERLRPVRVAQSTSVRLLQLKAIVRLRLCCLASKATPDKHSFAPVTEELLSYSASSTRAPCTPVARQKGRCGSRRWLQMSSSHRAPA